MVNSTQRPVYRFEDFEVDLESGEVWKAGRRLKVQDQAFKVLVALLKRAGQIVTREELRQLIWPEQNFGDFDHAINLAVTKLRSTLGDSASVPHLIETLPRRGYRFIAPLKDDSDPSPTHSIRPQPTAPSKEPLAKATGKKFWFLLGALPLILLCAVALLRIFPSHRAQPPTASEILPLVAMPGHEAEPTMSPDGRQVAFHYGGALHPGLYIAMIGGEKPLQLTENHSDHNPAWSPDGRRIAFARYSHSEDQKELYVMPALGGSPHRLYTAPAPWEDCNSLDWSPDGKSLVFPEALGGGAGGDRARLTLLSLTDLTARPLTSPHIEEFNCHPVFSPDGATIAFTSGPMGGIAEDVFVVDLAGGQPLRLTSGNAGGHPAWTQDGTEIIYPSCVKGVQSLWRIPASGGTPQRVAGAGEDVRDPSISRRGNQLAYQVNNHWETLWRLDLRDARHAMAPPVRIFPGRGGSWRPSYSPDGKEIVFESDRMGYSDIWMCESDGSHCVQLTDLHGTSGTARWSPDGRHISFESITRNYYGVGLIEVPDGTPHMLTTFPNANNGAPNWSRDGAWIYFYSSHDPGAYQLWKMPLKGGSPIRVTTKGGVYGAESSDGRFLYYASIESSRIGKKSLQSGQESYLPFHVNFWPQWALAPGGIYFQNPDIPPNGRIDFFDFSSGQSTPILVPEKQFPGIGGLALSPDGKSLLFGQIEHNESYIMIMKDFY